VTKLFPPSTVEQRDSAAMPRRAYTYQWFDLQGRVIDFEKLMARQKSLARPQQRRRSIRP
jgi:hypothetical protein